MGCDHVLRPDIERVLLSVKGDSSPGVPYSSLGGTNAEVLKYHQPLIVDAVVDRIQRLLSIDTEGLGSRDLIQLGLCDPVRLFVKNEPHKEAKTKAGRFRLIMSVSLVDQLVERLISSRQNRAEIMRWESIPSKPGIGLDDFSVATIWEQVAPVFKEGKLMETDISGFDWSVQEWELRLDMEARVKLCSAGPLLTKVMMNRVYCTAHSVFSLSDGSLIEQLDGGIQKSGSYNTSSTNSRIRVMLAYMAGSPWCIAMGDDSLEYYVPGSLEIYSHLGHDIKDHRVASQSFEFCSHQFQEGVAAPVNWSKTLYRLLSQPQSKIDRLGEEFVQQFCYEMRHSKELSSCLDLLEQVGWRHL
jgi:hypothetical protein